MTHLGPQAGRNSLLKRSAADSVPSQWASCSRRSVNPCPPIAQAAGDGQVGRILAYPSSVKPYTHLLTWLATGSSAEGSLCSVNAPPRVAILMTSRSISPWLSSHIFLHSVNVMSHSVLSVPRTQASGLLEQDLPSQCLLRTEEG